jgi:hypothetical protein
MLSMPYPSPGITAGTIDREPAGDDNKATYRSTFDGGVGGEVLRFEPLWSSSIAPGLRPRPIRTRSLPLR